jgi:vacuolar-type H+-ATPase subunit I/STV1
MGIDIDMVPRIQKLEGEHILLNQELKQMNKTLSKIETAIEKQNEISSDIRMLRQEFKSHIEIELESIKRQNERIEHIENNLSKIVWIVFTAIVAGLIDFISKGHI